MKKLDVQNLVDQLGKVKAKLSDLSEQEEVLRQALIEAGVTEAEGKLFRATVSVAEVEKVAWRDVCEAAKVSSRIVKKFTKVEERTTVKVVARKG